MREVLRCDFLFYTLRRFTEFRLWLPWNREEDPQTCEQGEGLIGCCGARRFRTCSRQRSASRCAGGKDSPLITRLPGGIMHAKTTWDGTSEIQFFRNFQTAPASRLTLPIPPCGTWIFLDNRGSFYY